MAVTSPPPFHRSRSDRPDHSDPWNLKLLRLPRERGLVSLAENLVTPYEGALKVVG